MRARSVIEVKEDGRDERPIYRIDFWERPAEGYAWNNDVWIIEDAESVTQIVEWAESHARGRRYQILVKTGSTALGDSYVLLAGADPNDPLDPETAFS